MKSRIISIVVLTLSFVAVAEQPDSRPNILLVIADDWSYGHAGAYGCEWVETPNFDWVAKNGILFDRAFTPNAKCAPSRAVILTGRYSWQLEEAANHWCYFPEKFGTYVERLESAGYFAGYTGKGWGPGIAKGRNLTGRRFTGKRSNPPASRISKEDYAANFKSFLEKMPRGKPWVFWCGTHEPHRGYEYGSGVRLGKNPKDIRRVPTYWPDNDRVRNDMLDYAVEVEHYDTHLGRILAHLKEAGQLENTLIVATSDHGMPFPRVKGQAYEYSNHVPLAIQWIGRINDPGRICREFISFVDLAPTFLDAAGVEGSVPIMQPMSGRSLMPLIEDEAAGLDRDFVLVGKERHDVGRPDDVGYPIRGIRTDKWLYLKNYEPERWPAGNPKTGYLNCDGSPTKTENLYLRRSGEDAGFWRAAFGKRPKEELYCVDTDPDCMKNLAANGAVPELKRRLEKRMEAALRDQRDPRMFGRGDVFDNYPFANKKGKDFYNRYMNGERPPSGWVNSTDFEKSGRRGE